METLTAMEVAALTGLDERAIRKDVEVGIIGETSPPRFAEQALVYFAALSTLEFSLGIDDRRLLYRRIRDAFTARNDVVALGRYLHFDLSKAKSDIEDRLERFLAWKKKRTEIDKSVLGGEPTFKGTRLAVRNIGGMLLRGAKPKELRTDYPYLTDDDVEFAKLYAIAYPRMGRPRDKAPPR